MQNHLLKFNASQQANEEIQKVFNEFISCGPIEERLETLHDWFYEYVCSCDMNNVNKDSITNMYGQLRHLLNTVKTIQTKHQVDSIKVINGSIQSTEGPGH